MYLILLDVEHLHLGTISKWEGVGHSERCDISRQKGENVFNLGSAF